MSKNELNSTAQDLTSVRQMIEELQAEAGGLSPGLFFCPQTAFERREGYHRESPSEWL